MSDITRYDIFSFTADPPEWEEAKEGTWVRFEDVEASLSQANERIKVLTVNLELAIEWLETMPSSDKTGHKDLAKIIKDRVFPIPENTND